MSSTLPSPVAAVRPHARPHRLEPAGANETAGANEIAGGQRFVPLPSPGDLRRALPVPAATSDQILEARAAISSLLHGDDDNRLLVVVGPCSIHDRGSALEYARRLAAAAHWHRRELVVVMRAYVEKPRSGTGWKGYLNDPDLDGRCDSVAGVTRSRELLLEIGALGLPCASELLDPIASHYLEDLLAWTAIGARTASSQPHRELASAAPMPVGVKNAPCGDIGAAVAGALASRAPHTVLGIDDSGRAGAVRTNGNPDAHVVLRGGHGGPNHGPEAVGEAAGLAKPLGLARPILVDCSHANSGKDPRRQVGACRTVLEQVAAGHREIAGLLLESHLRGGRQELGSGQPPRPDQSITDTCISWEQTAKLLEEAAEAVRAGLQ